MRISLVSAALVAALAAAQPGAAIRAAVASAGGHATLIRAEPAVRAIHDLILSSQA